MVHKYPVKAYLIRMPVEIYTKINRLSINYNRSINSLINQAMREFLIKHLNLKG